MNETTSLLILQPTPFCNINCSYCYLPNRDLQKRMSLATFTRILDRLEESSFVGEKISFVWHAGEPLALPISYYHDLFEQIKQRASLAERVTHSLQTNGMLINDAWCEFFKQNEISVGVSIDGPEFLHDAFRRDRRGRGTLRRALAGVECLQRYGIEFHVIAVLTSKSLDHAREIFEFFSDLGVRNIGFNIEEKEGANQSSSLEDGELDQRIKKFFQEIYQLQRSSDNRLSVREFDRACQSIVMSDLDNASSPDGRLNDQSSPIRIISVDYEGSFSTFSPELLGMERPDFGNFVFGNVHDQGFESIWTNDNFVKTQREINGGVAKCRAECDYFALCGGGAPSNKLYENGSFDSTETMYCKYTIQYPIDIALNDLEKQLFGEAQHAA